MDTKRRPIVMRLNGYGKVESQELYTVTQAEDIMRMIKEAFDTVAESPDDIRVYPRGIKVTTADAR